MDGAFVGVVAKPHHEVSDIDNNRAFNWGCLNPLSVTIQDLKSSNHILPKESEELEISVATKSDGVLRDLFFSGYWVIVEDSVSTWICRSAVKVVLIQVKREREDSD